MRMPRLRMSVRLSMILVLALGSGLGGIVHRARVQRDAVVGIERAGGYVRYDSLRGAQSPIPARKLWAPGWLVERVGLDFFDDVIACGKRDGSAGGVLHHIGRLPRLEYLDLQGCDFS